MRTLSDRLNPQVHTGPVGEWTSPEQVSSQVPEVSEGDLHSGP